LALGIVKAHEKVKGTVQGSSSKRRKTEATKAAASPSVVAESYEQRMKGLQIQEGDEEAFEQFHYSQELAVSSGAASSAKLKRLAHESITLTSSMPMDSASAMFLCVHEERPDCMKVLITGPADTPYQNGCFEFNVLCGANYPTNCPSVNLITTGKGSIRFNPNLYHCGKVCLSILGTWSGAGGENWDPKISSLLQVFVSIQSLILVDEPYYNEPGHECEAGTPQGDSHNLAYCNIIRYGTVKFAMLQHLQHPPLGLEKVVQAHFWLKRDEILK